jgi:serine/threonine protein kinase
VKIADFGFSKRAINSHAIAHTGGGTPLYMAPEMQGIIEDGSYTRCEKVTYTEAVDIWAVGVMTFQIFTGRHPFRPGEIEKYTTRKLRFPTRRLRRAMASDEACHFVKSLMTPQPTLRPDARECLRHYWLQSHTTFSDASECSSHSGLNESGPAEEVLEASATWASEKESRRKIEEPTSIYDNETAASNIAPLNFIASAAAPTVYLSSPVFGKEKPTKKALVEPDRDMALGCQDVNDTDFANITQPVIKITDQRSEETRRRYDTNHLDNHAIGPDALCTPPDTFKNNVTDSDTTREYKPQWTTTASKPNISMHLPTRGAGAQVKIASPKVMEKINQQSGNTRRSSRDYIYEESGHRRRESSKSHHLDDEVSGVESSLLSSNPTASQRSHGSSAPQGSKMTNNPRLLEMVEETIKRMILPEIKAIKEGHRAVEESRHGSIPHSDDKVRCLNKTSSPLQIASRPKVALSRESDDPRTILRRRDSEHQKRRKFGSRDEPSSSRKSSSRLTIREDLARARADAMLMEP